MVEVSYVKLPPVKVTRPNIGSSDGFGAIK